MTTRQQKPKSIPPTHFDALPASAQVPVRDVAAILGVSEVTIWRWAKAGKLPAPRKFGESVTRWNVGDVRAALAEMVATPPRKKVIKKKTAKATDSKLAA